MINSFLFVQDSPSYKYGVGKYITCLKEGFACRDDIKFNIVVRESFDYNEVTIINESENVRLYYIPRIDIKKNREKLAFKRAERLIDLLETIHPFEEDTVIHFVHWNGLFIASAFAKRYSFPIIYDIHFIDWQFDLKGNKQKFVEYWNNLTNGSEKKDDEIMKPGVVYEKQFCNIADQIIVRNSQMKIDIMDTFKPIISNISIIHNGIKINSVATFIKRDKRKSMNFNLDEKLILFAGRLEDQKGLHILIKAFRILLNETTDIRLLIAGNGDYDNYMSQCKDIWSKITFTGMLNAEKLADVYSIADVGVAPSLYEPFGYVIIEMMQHYLPVITTNIDGPNEIIDDGINGLKVNVFFDEDGERSIAPEELAEKIKLLLYTSDLGKRLSDKAFEKLNNQFTSEQMSSKIITVYKEQLLKFRSQRNIAIDNP